MRSDTVKKGVQQAPHRSLFNALGMTQEELDRPLIGVVSSYNEIVPGHMNLDKIANAVKQGVAMAGGTPVVFPAIAVIGDSTFTHSGMTGLLDAVNDRANITVVISDNLTTAMTGGQDSAGTNKFEAICLGLGVEPEHVRVVVPLPKNMEEITRTIREEIEYKGVSVIIPRRECIQTLNRKLRQKKADKA